MTTICKVYNVVMLLYNTVCLCLHEIIHYAVFIITIECDLVIISVSQIENMHICGSKFFSRFRDIDDYGLCLVLFFNRREKTFSFSR